MKDGPGATAAFARLLKADPDLVIDDEGFSPTMRTALANAQRGGKAGSRRGAGRLAECESLLLCVTTPSVRAFRPSDARCWLQRVSGAGPSPEGVQHPVPVRRVSVWCTFRSAYFIFNIFAMIFTFLRRDIREGVCQDVNHVF